MSTKIIDFQAKADGVFSTIDKVQQKSKTLFDQELENARQYSSIIDQQIKKLEQKSKVLESQSKLSSRNVRDFSTQFEVDKQDRLRSIDRDINRLGQTRKEVSFEYRKGKLTPEEYEDAVRDIKIETSSLNKEREGISNASVESSPEYRTLREIERSSKLTSSSFRENLDQLKQQNKTLTDVNSTLHIPPNEPVGQSGSDTNSGGGSRRTPGRRRRRSGGSGGDWEEYVGDLFSAEQVFETLDRFVKTVVSFTGTKNGFDQISHVRETEGQVGGSILGTIIGGAVGGPVGAAFGGNIGGSIFGSLLKGVGELEQQGATLREEQRQAEMKYRATTGGLYNGFSSMSDFGVTSQQFAQYRTQFALARGTASNSDQEAKMSIYFEKGFGVQQSTSESLEELLRSSREGYRDLGGLLGGILKEGQNGLFKGGDRTFLNEFLSKNFSTIQRELLKSQNTVASGTTFDILNRFNNIGGQFSSRDYRSTGLISSIQNSLTNPQSDVAKAYSFDALRRMNPGMDIEQLLEERQKGLSSPTYLRSMIQIATQMGGGSRSASIMSLAGLLGLDNNLVAARQIYEGRGNFNKAISQNELSSAYSEEYLRKQAEQNTSLLEKNPARIQEAVMKGVTEGSVAIAKAIKDAFDSSHLELRGDKMYIVPGGVKKNETHIPPVRMTAPVNSNSRNPGVNNNLPLSAF